MNALVFSLTYSLLKSYCYLGATIQLMMSQMSHPLKTFFCVKFKC